MSVLHHTVKKSIALSQDEDYKEEFLPPSKWVTLILLIVCFYCNVLWLLMQVDATHVTRDMWECKVVILRGKCGNGSRISDLVTLHEGHHPCPAVMAHWHYYQQWRRQCLVFIFWEKLFIPVLIEQNKGQADWGLRAGCSSKTAVIMWLTSMTVKSFLLLIITSVSAF